MRCEDCFDRGRRFLYLAVYNPQLIGISKRGPFTQHIVDLPGPCRACKGSGVEPSRGGPDEIANAPAINCQACIDC